MGLVSGARTALSPNSDARPDGFVPELVVVHGISLPPGRFGGPWIERLFLNTLPPERIPISRPSSTCASPRTC
jgi:AmpD protein